MSMESEDEILVRLEVNQVFHDVFGRSARGRIQLAAYAVGDSIGYLRGLIQARDDAYQSLPAASSDMPLDREVFISGRETAIILDNHGAISVEDSTPIQEAVAARDQSLERARIMYGLSRRQARKALRLAEKSFWLFNIDDPGQE